MPRGTTSDIGTERVAPNGYRYRKTEWGWELVHRLLAEEKLGRCLHQNEYATFVDGDKTNFDPANIEVRIRGRSSLRRRLALIEARIEEYTAVRDDLQERLRLQDSLASKNV
jgi:hypothetical protein